MLPCCDRLPLRARRCLNCCLWCCLSENLASEPSKFPATYCQLCHCSGISKFTLEISKATLYKSLRGIKLVMAAIVGTSYLRCYKHITTRKSSGAAWWPPKVALAELLHTTNDITCQDSQEHSHCLVNEVKLLQYLPQMRLYESIEPPNRHIHLIF